MVGRGNQMRRGGVGDVAPGDADAQPGQILLHGRDPVRMDIQRRNRAFVLHQGCKLGRFAARRGAHIEHALPRLDAQPAGDLLRAGVLHVNLAAGQKRCQGRQIALNRTGFRQPGEGLECEPGGSQFLPCDLGVLAERIEPDEGRRRQVVGGRNAGGAGLSQGARPVAQQPGRMGQLGFPVGDGGW